MALSPCDWPEVCLGAEGSRLATDCRAQLVSSHAPLHSALPGAICPRATRAASSHHSTVAAHDMDVHALGCPSGVTLGVHRLWSMACAQCSVVMQCSKCCAFEAADQMCAGLQTGALFFRPGTPLLCDLRCTLSSHPPRG